MEPLCSRWPPSTALLWTPKPLGSDSSLFQAEKDSHPGLPAWVGIRLGLRTQNQTRPSRSSGRFSNTSNGKVSKHPYTEAPLRKHSRNAIEVSGYSRLCESFPGQRQGEKLPGGEGITVETQVRLKTKSHFFKPLGGGVEGMYESPHEPGVPQRPHHASCPGHSALVFFLRPEVEVDGNEAPSSGHGYTRLH